MVCICVICDERSKLNTCANFQAIDYWGSLALGHKYSSDYKYSHHHTQDSRGGGGGPVFVGNFISISENYSNLLDKLKGSETNAFHN